MNQFKKNSNSRILLSLLFVCMLFAGMPPAFAAEENRPPNIVLFFCDDLGYGDVGCYGHPYARTPAIDRLAEEGTRFTQHYVTGVTCNPSRTGLMSGLHPARFKRYCADFGLGGRVTITDLLKKRGYATGHFGKWHMGPDDMVKSGTYGLDTVMRIGKSKGESAGRDDDLTAAAIKFIKANADRPFYVNIWGHSTHFPVNVPPALTGPFKGLKVNRKDFSSTMQQKFDECLQIGGNLDEAMGQYLGDVHSIDRNVDRVLKAIDELGIRNNTIVVFSSDHGPAPVLVGREKMGRKYSCNMLGYAGEFRGGKHTQFEGGIRVPFIIRWPGHVKAGRVDSESVTSFIDWMPTLSAIAGVEALPEKLDGEDISGIWLGKRRKRAKPLFWRVSAPKASPAIREGKWKLHLNTRRGQAVALYDLSADPSESRNVADRHPSVAAGLKAKLEAWTAGLPASYEKLGTGKEKKKDRKKAAHGKLRK